MTTALKGARLGDNCHARDESRRDLGRFVLKGGRGRKMVVASQHLPLKSPGNERILEVGILSSWLRSFFLFFFENCYPYFRSVIIFQHKKCKEILDFW